MRQTAVAAAIVALLIGLVAFLYVPSPPGRVNDSAPPTVGATVTERPAVTAAPDEATAPEIRTPIAPPTREITGAVPDSRDLEIIEAAKRAQAEASEAPRAPTPPVRFRTSQEGIRAAIATAIPDVKACYESWLAMNPTLAGKLVISFRIEPDREAPDIGRINEVEIAESGLDHTFFEGCVLRSMADLEFSEPPPAGLEVNYPLFFANVGSDEPGSP